MAPVAAGNGFSQFHVTLASVTRQDELIGSVHDAAQRAADLLALLLPRAGHPREPGPAAVAEVLRAHGEPEPVEISAADVDALRAAALELRTVFTAEDAGAAATQLNRLLAAAHPPRLTTHHGTSGWHLHVDGSDDAPWGEWFLTSSTLALAALLAERQAPPGGICASPSCARPFVNVGRGPARRYCSAACGTRERVAAHRGAARARRTGLPRQPRSL
jgi:predicted RNA-binding Zn ribbon-like protein